MNRLFSCLISFLFTIPIYSADKVLIPQVIPCVVQGTCGACGNTCCSGCLKNSSGPFKTEKDPEPSACGVCDNKSIYCMPLIEGIERNIRPFKSIFIPRSQGANTARELAGWEEFIHQFDVGEYYLATGHVLGYYRSFRPQRIARELFGESVLHFVGSHAGKRGPCALLADNFGLSPSFRGSLKIEPIIENVIFDNQFYIGLDPIYCGLYARIHLPIVYTRWNLNLCQTIETAPCTQFPACYMGEQSSPALCDIFQALNGQFTFGDMKEPWQFGRIVPGAHGKTGLADIDLILGCDFWQTDTYHFGFFGLVVAPTGNKPNARFLFEPILGNAKHWELGVGISGHLVLWERDADQNLAVYLEGNVTHLFRNTQMRSFDFCNNGSLSRYMLLKELTQSGDSLVYADNLINAINFTTRPVDVSVAAKGDISAKICYRSPCFIIDLGYNFYGQTDERLRLKNCADTRIFAIKGTEGVCGLEYQVQETVTPPQFGPLVAQLPLNASQSRATIREGAKTDNPYAVTAQTSDEIVVTAFSRQLGPIEGPDVIRAFESRPPVIVTLADLNLRTGKAPAQATHKLFGYLGYNLYEYERCFCPYIGLGGELELEARSRKERTALNQWALWIKGGFEF